MLLVLSLCLSVCLLTGLLNKSMFNFDDIRYVCVRLGPGTSQLDSGTDPYLDP